MLCRLGFEGREKIAVAQRQKQADMDRAAEEALQKKLREQGEKLSQAVDYNFALSDEVSAMEKLREASTKYDKTAPGE